jgi:hypothetical protein
MSLRMPTTIARGRTWPSILSLARGGSPRVRQRGWAGVHARQPRHSLTKALDHSDPELQPLVELLQRTDTLDDETSMDAAAHAAILTAARSLSSASFVPR